MTSLAACPRCGTALAIPITSHCEYCSAELSAVTSPTLKSTLRYLPDNPQIAKLTGFKW